MSVVLSDCGVSTGPVVVELTLLVLDLTIAPINGGWVSNTSN